MNPLRIIGAVCFLSGTICYSLASSGHAEGLETGFVDVHVGDVPSGTAFRLQASQGSGIVIRNIGGQSCRVRVDVLVPAVGELRKGARPIPDVSWIEVQPRELDLDPHGKGEFDVILRIPRKWRYRRNVYQAMIWSHTIPDGKHGMTISAGLKSRLRFRAR